MTFLSENPFVNKYFDVIVGDCVESMRAMPDQSVNCVVTSPPYFGLRDYGHDGQIGLEQTPAEFVAKLVDVFREVHRVLRDDGTLWLNLGDSYAAGKCGRADQDRNTRNRDGRNTANATDTGAPMYGQRKIPEGLKPKDLIGIPWLLAFALRADGWYLRQEIIWHKLNPMPESVTDRCTKAHEYLFLLSKSERYFFDSEAIKEPAAPSSLARWAQNVEGQRGSDRVPGKTNGTMKAVGGPRSRRDSFKRDGSKREQATPGQGYGTHRPDRVESSWNTAVRNRRSVWTVATVPYKGAHFATFPPDLIEPCILAGAPAGGIVLDPFFGSGTTGQVAQALGRQFIGIELNEAYKPLQDERLRQPSLLLEAA